MDPVAVFANVGGDAGNYGIGWFTLTLINAGIAQGKGRSGMNWFLLSLFLGPFATLLVVLRPPRLTVDGFVKHD